MDKIFAKHLFFLAILLFTITGVFAQTITVGTVDPGPYAPGSTVAVPISLGTTGSCLDKTSNQFQVILSNSSGSFASGTTVIGTYSGFYASFVNATLPSSLIPGSYNIEVVSTTPASTSSNTASITVQAGTAVTPAITVTESVAPGVYGRCVGTTSPFTVLPASGGTVTASFHNETSGSDEGTNITIPAAGYQFTPAKAYYTVIAKSTNGGVAGTYGYQLINNNLLNPFSPVGQPFACMPAGGKATLTFGVPFSGAIGINNNYPGTLYSVSWGDGTTSILDYCDIAQAGGLLSHDYTAPTCGSGTPLQVICQPSTPYCGSLTAPSTTTAKIIITPTVDFTLPAIACVGTAITVPNNSKPGPDYSTATQLDCNLQNPNALYDWYFDGTKVASGVNLSYSYVIPATATHGTHTILLHADAPADPNTPYCQATDVVKSICLENPPQPAFTIASPICITSASVSVNNTSVVDAAPCSTMIYTWSATPSTYSFVGGTNQNSISPQFKFTAAGTYTVTLNISDAANTACASRSTTQTIVVQSTPVATLSPDVSLCGDNQTLTFDGTNGSSTKVVFTGAASTDTYAWTVTPPAGGSAVFAGGTSASSQYPKITFVGYGTYTVNVTHTNACGNVSDSQNITFVQPPTVSAGTDQTVCAYPVPTVTLSGSVVGGTGFNWSSAGGGTFSSTTSLTPNYTPSASEISAGQATLTLTATSTAPCVTTTDQVTINITPQAKINSSATVATCSGQALNYDIIADHSGTSFTWTAAVTTGTASGFTASGSGNNITDLIITSGTTDAIVTYTISPTFNSCPGVPFTLQVTVHPLPSVTATAPSPVCSNVAGNGTINLSSNVANTAYIWTSPAVPGVTGNSTQSTAILTNNIVDNLVNNNTTPAIVTYTITPYNGTCPGTPVVTTITVEPSAIAANAGPAQELCNVTSTTLHANDPTPQTGLWTQLPGPTPGVAFSAANDPSATVSGLQPGNVYQFQWTITASASCPTSSSTVLVTIDSPPIGGTATANPSEVCSGSGSKITLNGQTGSIVQWESSTDGGSTWTVISNTTATLIIPNLTQTTQYRAWIHNGASCPNVYSTTATVTVDQPPIASNAGPNDEVCNTNTYTLQGNNPAPGTGKWTIAGNPAGINFSDDTNPNAAVSGLVPGTTYQFTWTISNTTASCPPSTSTVTVIIDKAPVGGTTASDTHVCLGSNAGTITLTGQSGTIIRWEYSTVTPANWLPVTNTTNQLNYSNLTQTTQYRAVVQNGVCPVAYSSPTTITVDQPPIAAYAGPNDEVCSQASYNLQGNNPSPGKGKWTLVSGPGTIIFQDDTLYNSKVSGLLPGNTYQFMWTISNRTGSCPSIPSTVNIKDDQAPVGGTTLSSAHVCSGTNQGTITLTGQFGTILRWEYSDDNGASWHTITNITSLQSYLNLTQTTQYRAWLHNSGICPDVPSTVTTITVDPPPPESNPGPNDEICDQPVYTLRGNAVSLPNTGLWTMVSGPSTATFTNATSNITDAKNLVPGTYVFRWTISNATACPPSSNDVTIIIDKSPVGGTTSSDATVCAGGNSGQIQLAGQLGSVARWEFSVDGTNWQPIANTTSVQNYLNLTQTTQYRAVVRSGITCPNAYSTPTTITVNPQTPIADAGPNYNLCNQYSTILKGNNPGTFAGTWTQTGGPAVTIVDPNNNTTSVTGMTGGNIYKFTWTIKGLPPCGDTFSTITIGVSSDITPSFAMDQSKGCGPLVVTFTNTSTPTPTGTFVWNFGDGSPQVTAVNPPAHTFQPSNDGTEAIYEVSMTPTSNCGSQAPYVAYIKVSPLKPVASFNPAQTSACGTFTLSAHNLSPGDNAQYDFYLKDANGNLAQHLTYPDTRDAVFQPMTVTQQTYYSMYLVVIDKCGNQVTSPSVNIPVSPSSLISKIQIKGDINSVCIGSPITFQNISSGGDRFTITIYDSNKNVILTLPAGTDDMNYTPTATGVYYVSITAGNAGCGDAPVSALKQFTVYPIPAPNFTWTSDQNFNVTFNNTTPGLPDIPASSLTYKWDFGDGSKNDPSYIPATHHFDFSKAPFTVTLTATTPGTDCSQVTSQSINITFKGNLFLPNAFIPASSDRNLNTFIAKGSGMKTWHMQIFNNFGQLVWETTKLDNNGAPVEGWDGTYKGRIVEQGVYIWQISATLLNGEEWKGMSYHNSSPSKTGAIHLIR